MLRRFSWLATALVLGLTSCSQDPGGSSLDSPSREPAEELSAEGKSTTGDPSSSSITLEVAGAADVEELVAAEKGKVVVVDLWALW